MAENSEELPQLTEQHNKAIQLKYLGYKYYDIAQEIGVPVDTVAKWFSPAYNQNGVWSAYVQYATEQNELLKQVAEERLHALIGKAVERTGELMESADRDSVSLAAAEDIIERVLGKTLIKMQLSGTEQLQQNVELLKALTGANGNK